MAFPQGFGPRRSSADVFRQQLANQLLAQGGDTSPIQSPWQGAARLAQALMGGYMTQRNQAREEEQQQAFSQGVTEAMAPRLVPGAAGPGPRPDATMAPPSMGEVAQNLARNPATAHLAPQFQMMDLQQRAAAEQAARQPFNLRPGERRMTADGRVIADNPAPVKPENRFQNVPGVGLVDVSGDAPRVALPAQREQTPYQVVTTAEGIFAIDPRNPTGPRVRIGDKPERNEGEGREFAQERNLRTEFTNASKPFEDLRQHWTRLNAAHSQRDGAGDIAMVYSFMKMLDPTSVVREGEFATASNAGGVPEHILNLYNRVIRGERLPDQVRDSFLEQGARQFDGLARTQVEIENRFRGLARANNLNPERVVPDVFGRLPRPNLDQPFAWTPPAAPGRQPGAQPGTPEANRRPAPALPPGAPPLPPGFDLVAPR